MPNIASAKKRARQTLVRKARNSRRRSKVRNLERGFVRAVDDGDLETAKAAFVKLVPEFEKAGRLGVFKRGMVSRRISRLNARAKRLAAAG